MSLCILGLRIFDNFFFQFPGWRSIHISLLFLGSVLAVQDLGQHVAPVMAVSDCIVNLYVQQLIKSRFQSITIIRAIFISFNVAPQRYPDHKSVPASTRGAVVCHCGATGHVMALLSRNDTPPRAHRSAHTHTGRVAGLCSQGLAIFLVAFQSLSLLF